MIATNKKNAKIRLAELRHERELTQKISKSLPIKGGFFLVLLFTLSISFYSVFCPGE